MEILININIIPSILPKNMWHDLAFHVFLRKVDFSPRNPDEYGILSRIIIITKRISLQLPQGFWPKMSLTPMGPTGPGPGYRASTARSSHCNTQGITFLPVSDSWGRIPDPWSPRSGARYKARKAPSNKKTTPQAPSVWQLAISLVNSGGIRIGIQKSRITSD